MNTMDLSFIASPNLSSPRSHRYVYMDEQNINSLLLCCICEKPFVDPVTDQNRQRGCRTCFAPKDGPFTDITEWIVMEMLNGLLVQCIQCGEINIRRDALDNHEQITCRRAIGTCTAADIKCPWRGPQEQRGQHLAECIFEPLRPALAEIFADNKRLEAKVEQLERQLQELRAAQ